MYFTISAVALRIDFPQMSKGRWLVLLMLAVVSLYVKYFIVSKMRMGIEWIYKHANCFCQLQGNYMSLKKALQRKHCHIT